MFAYSPTYVRTGGVRFIYDCDTVGLNPTFISLGINSKLKW